MLGLFGIVGGAALEIRRLRQRGQAGGGNDPQSLGSMRKELEEFAKQLEVERRATQAATSKAESLAQQNVELMMSNLELGQTTEKLQREANELVVANRHLSEKVDELSASRDADAAQFESDLAALRDRVAAVLQRMFASEIDEAAAVQELRELGCEVRFVPESRRRWGRNNSSDSGASFTIEPKLLLEDPAKMARLMQAARSQSGGSSPRLLTTTSSSNMTPRMDRIQAALTIGGPSTSGPAPSGGPRFVLSWLGNGPEPSSVAKPAGEVQQDAVRDKAADAGKDTAALAAPQARSPSKATPAPVAQDGALVFSAQAKGKANKSRLGLSLTDAAAAVFKKGGPSSSAGAPQVKFELPGDVARGDSDNDVRSGTRDLVTRG